MQVLNWCSKIYINLTTPEIESGIFIWSSHNVMFPSLDKLLK